MAFMIGLLTNFVILFFLSQIYHVQESMEETENCKRKKVDGSAQEKGRVQTSEIKAIFGHMLIWFYSFTMQIFN